MKICYIGNPNSLNVKVFIDYFSKEGHEIHTFWWYPYQHKILGNLVHHQYINSKNKSPMIRKVNIINKDYIKKRERKKKFYAKQVFDLYEMMKIKRYIKQIKPDIVHGHEASGNGYSTASLSDFPRILTCWGSDINKFPWESRWLHYKVYHALHKVDLIHVTNDDFLLTIVEKFNIDQNKIRSIPWGIDTYQFDPERLNKEKIEKMRKFLRINKNETVITYPAGFRDKDLQNYVNLLKAFSRIAKEKDDIRLVMLTYNRTSGMDEIIQILNKEKLWNRVSIIDNEIPHEDMPYLFEMTDIMTLLHDVDQMSVSISESMLMGCINLFSRVKPYTSSFKDGENCIFTNQKDPNDIAEKMNFMIDNIHDLKNIFLKKNIKRIIKYNSRKIQMEKIEKMYHSILIK